MINGQMYLVRIHATVDERQSHEMDYLIVATSEDDALMRVSYLVDLSEYRTWRYVQVENRGRAHLMRAKALNAEPTTPDAVVERRPDGVQEFFQEIDRKKKSKKWVVHASTTCYADTANKAAEKLRRRMHTGDALAITAEEVGANSGFSMPRDVSHFPKARIVRG